MATAEPVPTKGSDHELESAKYLWEEYKYRHDLIWRLLFRPDSASRPVTRLRECR